MTVNDKIAWKTQVAVYSCGAFNHSIGMMLAVVMPLWLLSIEASPFMMGIAIGSRYLLPLFLSIHGGALMDRFGARRIMLWFAIISAVCPILFPALPFLWAVILLQMILGLADTMGWSGAQAMIGLVMKGNALHAGRLAFTIRIGHFLGPLLIGVIWDWFGPWGAFSTLSIWGIGSYVATLFLPNVAQAVSPQTTNWRELIPRYSDYINTFRLLAIPAVLFVIMVTFVRHSSTSMQNSFYVVYLKSIDISGTEIGALFAASAALGALGALATSRITRFLEPAFFLIISVVFVIAFMGLTPALNYLPFMGVYGLLIIVIGLRGSCLGFSQVLMISILGKSLQNKDQGKGVGLRTTVNRIMNTALPPIVGAIVGVAGLETSFYIVASVGLIMMVAIYYYYRLHRGFRSETSTD